MSETTSRPALTSLLAPLKTLLPVFVALALVSSARTASAQSEDDPEVVAQAKEHYKAGLEAYKAGKYDVAIRELKKAYLLKRLPPLLINIGATYRKMGDLDLSLHFYQKYLDEAPADAKDRGEVEKIVGEIKTQKATAATEDTGNGGKTTEAPPPVRDNGRGGGGSEWNHNVIDAVPPEMPIDVRVTAGVMKGVKVYVYYRGSGQADFNSVLMKRRGREKVGRIPAEAVNGRSLQYYIEAKDTAGTVVKSSGSQANPNIIMVEEGVRPVMLASSSRRDEDREGQTEEDEDRPRKKKPQRDLDAEEAPTTGQVNLSDDEPVRTPPRKASKGGLSGLQKAGIGLLVGGAALGGAGIGLLVAAKGQADALTTNSQNPFDGTNNIFFNNDPNAGSVQEKDRVSRGKTFNGAGIALASIGGAAAVAGAACMIADAVTKADKAKPKKKRKKRRVVEDEEEETWYISPVTGPGLVGVTGGFSF